MSITCPSCSSQNIDQDYEQGVWFCADCFSVLDQIPEVFTLETANNEEITKNLAQHATSKIGYNSNSTSSNIGYQIYEVNQRSSIRPVARTLINDHNLESCFQEKCIFLYGESLRHKKENGIKIKNMTCTSFAKAAIYFLYKDNQEDTKMLTIREFIKKYEWKEKGILNCYFLIKKVSGDTVDVEEIYNIQHFKKDIGFMKELFNNFALHLRIEKNKNIFDYISRKEETIKGRMCTLFSILEGFFTESRSEIFNYCFIVFCVAWVKWDDPVNKSNSKFVIEWCVGMERFESELVELIGKFGNVYLSRLILNAKRFKNYIIIVLAQMCDAASLISEKSICKNLTSFLDMLKSNNITVEMIRKNYIDNLRTSKRKGEYSNINNIVVDSDTIYSDIEEDLSDYLAN